MIRIDRLLMKKNEFAVLLGMGGLLPFIGLSLMTTSLDQSLVKQSVQALVLYGGLILTFVGALHWGAMLSVPHIRIEPARLRMFWSVLPQLYAWGVLLMPAPKALPLLALGLVLSWLVDLYFYRAQGNLGWFIKLRSALTLVATVSLLFAWYKIK